MNETEAEAWVEQLGTIYVELITSYNFMDFESIDEPFQQYVVSHELGFLTEMLTL